MSTIQLTVENDEGEAETMDLPSIMEVCCDCEGHGSVLCDGMRGHAYSAEEFYESFDDEEDREAYFTRGGKYDVQCSTCKGKNVVPVVDEEHLTPEQKVFYKLYEEAQERRARYDAEDRATRRMESGGWD